MNPLLSRQETTFYQTAIIYKEMDARLMPF